MIPIRDLEGINNTNILLSKSLPLFNRLMLNKDMILPIPKIKSLYKFNARTLIIRVQDYQYTDINGCKMVMKIIFGNGVPFKNEFLKQNFGSNCFRY